ncbi:MAG: hypothetical protein HQ567_24490 [Candidatus Nealsonbacteria bacterium]|nr:hypothetical protein [Candidatus Nealsonbacteria bacterium]
MNCCRRRLVHVLAMGIVALSMTGRLYAGPLVDAGSEWFYSDTGRDLGTVWRGPEYDDGGWDSALAELGYNNANTVTSLDYGYPADKFPTTYFRQRFTVTAEDLANIQHLSLQLIRDDGAAVYINGTEVRRDNLDPYAAYGTYAESFVSGAAAESTFYETLFVPGALLHVGDDNLIAVEIHQAAPNSVDLGMDLALFGHETPLPYGDVTPETSTGFEEVSAGAQLFARGPGDSELAWSVTGGDTTTAEVTDQSTDPNDPANTHQLHVNQAAVDIFSEPINVQDYIDLQVSVDVRVWDIGAGFEGADDIDLSVLATPNGGTEREYFWLEIQGAACTALDLGGEHGPFTTFVSPMGLIPDNMVTLRVVLDADPSAASEHVIFDNVVVSGMPVTEIYRLTWDGGGDGQWADVDGGSGKSRWLDIGSNPHELFPMERRTHAVVRTDTVTVAADRGARTLIVEDGGIVAVADAATLNVFESTNFNPGTKLVLGQNARLIAGADGGTLDSVDAGPGATIDGDVLVTGTLAPLGSTGMVTVGEGQMTLANSAIYAAKVSLADTAAGVIEVATDGSLHLGGTLAVGATDRADASSWAPDVSRTIVNSPNGAVTGGFAAVVPTPATDATSHVGQGAFLRDVSETAAGVDVTLFIALGGDADGDGKVWLSDWAALRANFGNSGTGKAWTNGNFDPWRDDKVGLSDWAALRANFGNADYTGDAAAAVPEPGTLAMLLGGLLALTGSWIRENLVKCGND